MEDWYLKRPLKEMVQRLEQLILEMMWALLLSLEMMWASSTV